VRRYSQAEKDRAHVLYRAGGSLNSVSAETGVSKSTLSLWLRDEPKKRQPVPASRKSAVAAMHAAIAASVTSRRAALRAAPRFAGTVNPTTLTRRQKGAAAELAVAFRLHLLGHEVFKPVADGAKEDWVVRTSRGRYWRLSVRWVGVGGGASLTRTVNGKTTRISASEYDFLAAYCLQLDSVFVWSSSELTQFKSSVRPSIEAHEAWHKLLGTTPE
jgi:transposase-like protein